MNEKPRILVLTLSFGAGHIRAAESVVAEIERQSPDAEIRMIDALENCALWFRAFYVWTYWWMIRYAPQIWERFFNARAARRDEQTAPVWTWRRGCKKVFAEIENFRPDLIVACEVGASEIAVIARRADLTTARIFNVITDFEAEPIWVKPEIEKFFVASETVAAELRSWNADGAKIEVCGIPLDASFGAKHDKAKTRAQFNLDSRPVVLLMGGGMGPTKMHEVAARLLQTDENFQIVALPAKDAQAKIALEKLRSSPTVALHITGWTNKIAELMQIADVLATKPGGLTLSEAAVCELPCVLFDAIPGPEEKNAARVVQSGAGVMTRGTTETALEILRLLKDAPERERMAVNATAIAQPNAAEKIVNSILKTRQNVQFAVHNDEIFKSAPLRGVKI